MGHPYPTQVLLIPGVSSKVPNSAILRLTLRDMHSIDALLFLRLATNMTIFLGIIKDCSGDEEGTSKHGFCLQ